MNGPRDRAAGMLRTMAEMQDSHNVLVHPDWRTQEYPYYRAIWVECAELLDHYGWKWWKAQYPDLDQVKLEIVDIWHFGLSDLLREDALTVEGEGADAVVELLSAGPDGREVSPEGFRGAVESLAAATLTTRRFDPLLFREVLDALPMSYEELFDMYVGKNVLNGFRQNHGYKSGSYRKIWSGREDNEHLVEILATLGCEPGEVPEALYAELERRYAEAAPA